MTYGGQQELNRIVETQTALLAELCRMVFRLVAGLSTIGGKYDICKFRFPLLHVL